MNDKTKDSKINFTCISAALNPCYIGEIKIKGRKYNVIDNVVLRLGTEYDIKDGDLTKIASQIMEALNKDEKPKPAREEGYYWVKYGGKWTVAEWTSMNKWYITGAEEVINEDVFNEIDERLIIRDEHPGCVEISLGRYVKIPDEELTVAYLLDLHPELTYELASDLLNYSRSQTITLKGCYGNGRIIYPEWKKQLPK